MIADEFATFLFDLDGVVYIGEKPLPGARSALRRLRKRGKTLRFLTNDPRPTREGVAARLGRLGIEASVQEVVTCGWSTALYLRRTGVQSAYVVGSEGLGQELGRAGIEITGDENAEAVVVGCDERVSYSDIRRAVWLIGRRARFIATNEDPTFPTPNGPAPATGAIVAAVRTASGAEPHVVGKPHAPMFEAALKDLDPTAAVMIGDRLATDILGAHQQGIAALLLKPEAEAAQRDGEGAAPDLVIASLEALFKRSIVADE